MDLVLIKQESNEWQYMWDYVYALPYNNGLDKDIVNQWEYVGSLRNDGRTLHQFKHGLIHPDTLVLTASPDMSPDDIHKVIKLI